MPELPEVEYVRERLQRWLGRRELLAVRVHDARIVRPGSARAFEKATVGQRIEKAERRGKRLRLLLAGGTRIFGHLAMTGWFERTKEETPLRFERVRFTVRGGHVVYVDARRWGQLLASDDDIAAWTALGPDPLHDTIDVDELRGKLARRKTSSIKEALLDQRLLAGVGNIHAIEALWKAKIDPRSHAAAITTKDLRAIVRGIDWTIERTLEDLRKGDDGAKDPFVVYGHKGDPCPRCKTPLSRIELGGRTTTFCPGCQRRITKV